MLNFILKPRNVHFTPKNTFSIFKFIILQLVFLSVLVCSKSVTYRNIRNFYNSQELIITLPLRNIVLKGRGGGQNPGVRFDCHTFVIRRGVWTIFRLKQKIFTDYFTKKENRLSVYALQTVIY